MPPAFLPSVVPCLGLVAACGLSLISSANAQLQTYSFEAIIQSTEASSVAFADRNLGLVAGSTITGTFVIDLSAQDTLGDLMSFGSYRNYEPGSVSEYNPETKTNNALPRVSFSSLTLDLPKGAVAFGEISNDYGPGSFDSHYDSTAPRINISNGDTYTTESGKLGTASGDSLNFYQYIQINSSIGVDRFSRSVDFLLNDSTGTAFNSDGLPASLSLEQFDNASIYFSMVNNVMTIQYPGSEAIRGNAAFFAQITDITAVPEPSALALCSLAGGLLFIRRRR